MRHIDLLPLCTAWTIPRNTHEDPSHSRLHVRSLQIIPLLDLQQRTTRPRHRNEESHEPETRDLAHSCQLHLTELWLTCDMTMMPMLQNATMKCFREVLHHDTVGIDAMVLTFDSVSAKSPLRRASL